MGATFTLVVPAAALLCCIVAAANITAPARRAGMAALALLNLALLLYALASI